MVVIIWEYRVKPERVPEFEAIYGEHGVWAELFQKGGSYLGTELLRSPNDPHHYMTIDRWRSDADYELFLSTWKKEYRNLDTQSEDLTAQEISLGKWETNSDQTR